MLELEVVPEHGLCSDTIEFVLGMHFSHAVAIIQSLVGSIKGVQILYSDKEPLTVDLVINLTLDGIKLIFDPISQRLKIIEVHDLTSLKLKYCDVLFNCPEVSPTIEQIDQSFGATHPGVYDGEKQVFTLTFRGLSFEFPAQTQFQPSYGGIRQELGRLQFPPGESPRVSRMYIYQGSSLADCSAPALPVPRYPCLHHESIDVIRRQKQTMGLRIRLLSTPNINFDNSVPSQHGQQLAQHGELDHDLVVCNLQSTTSSTIKPENMSANRHSQSHVDNSYIQTNLDSPGSSGPNSLGPAVVRDVLFGHSVQDVISAIGAPARVFYKSEDKMKIHSPNAHRKAATQKSDYFYNYFTLGFDILFDARTNCVKKFVLHTNYPGHYNFNMYHRCMFELPLHPTSQNAGSQQYISLTPVTISPFSRWDEITNEKVKPSDRPVVLNRASSTNTTNPFGSTFCYGYQDIIFEVMPNFHIASITLYSQDNGLNLSAATTSNISPSTISLSTSNSSMQSNYSGPTTSGGFTASSNTFSGGGSGGGINISGRPSHHNKYQQGLNNRTADLDFIRNINDNDHIDNPIGDLNVIAKEDFFT